jgi:hypothetical protein
MHGLKCETYLDRTIYINLDADYTCQLLPRKEGLYIHRDTDPHSITLLRDPKRDAIRLSPDCSMPILDVTHEEHSYNRGDLIYTYWKLMDPIAPLAPLGYEELWQVPVTLMTGTSFIYQVRVRIRRGCLYNEFIKALLGIFIGLETSPWPFLVKHMVVGQVLRADYLRMCICPRLVTNPCLDLMKAMCALSQDRLDTALHRLIWYDWFTEISIGDFLPVDDNYQLVITPWLTRP